MSDDSEKQWAALHQELEDLAAGKVTPASDPASREDDIHRELDRLEIPVVVIA